MCDVVGQERIQTLKGRGSSVFTYGCGGGGGGAKKKKKKRHVDSTTYTYIIHVGTATVQLRVYLHSRGANAALINATVMRTHVHKSCHVHLQHVHIVYMLCTCA